MFERRNEYLRRMAERKRGSRNEYDMRNPYGSRGGYVDSRSMDYNRGYDSRRRDYRSYDGNMSEYSRPPYINYEDYLGDSARGYESRDVNNYDGHYMDYKYDGHNENNDEEKEYYENLKKWINKLKAKDKFNVPKEQILKQARNMGVNFDRVSEDEFYAFYLMLVNLHKKISDDYNDYINLAKDWLSDDVINMEPSEKVCRILYDFVLNKE